MTEEQKERHRQANKKWAENNKEKVKEVLKKYRENNKDKIKEKSKISRQKNKDWRNAYCRTWYANNKDAQKAACKEWREKNREYIKLNRIKNREIRNAKRKEYRLKNPQFAISELLRKRLINALQAANASKCISVTKLIDMSFPDFKKYIESKFTEGMSWGNRGEWHLDHKKPCAMFDLTDVEQQEECFHWSNFQPLWGKDNMSKGSVYEGKRYMVKRA